MAAEAVQAAGVTGTNYKQKDQISPLNWRVCTTKLYQWHIAVVVFDIVLVFLQGFWNNNILGIDLGINW